MPFWDKTFNPDRKKVPKLSEKKDPNCQRVTYN